MYLRKLNPIKPAYRGILCTFINLYDYSPVRGGHTGDFSGFYRGFYRVLVSSVSRFKFKLRKHMHTSSAGINPPNHNLKHKSLYSHVNMNKNFFSVLVAVAKPVIPLYGFIQADARGKQPCSRVSEAPEIPSELCGVRTAHYTDMPTSLSLLWKTMRERSPLDKF